MSWMYLLAAGLLEILWATAFKLSDGLGRFWPSVIGVTAAVASFVLLVLALKTLPVGTAYAVWAGIGVAGVAMFGIVALREPASTARVSFLALILAGIIGLKMVEA